MMQKCMMLSCQVGGVQRIERKIKAENRFLDSVIPPQFTLYLSLLNNLFPVDSEWVHSSERHSPQFN